jgi:MFS family permease/lysophospholipase L1-like esterase
VSVDRGRLIVLAVLAAQGFVLASTGVAAPWLMRSFSLDQATLARGLAWIAVSPVGAFLLARQADRLGRRTVIAAAIVLGSLASAGAALSFTFPTFITFDIVVLSSAGAITSCAIVWTGEASSNEGRARGQAFAGMATMLGGGVPLLLMPWLAATSFSWRGLFVAAAAPIVLLPFLPRDRVESPSAVERLFGGDHRRRAASLLGTTVLSTVATAAVTSWRYVHIVTDAGVAPAVASAIVIAAGIAGLGGFPIGIAASNRIGRVSTAASCLVVMALGIAWSFWGPPPGASRPWLWIGAGLAVAAAAGNAITVGANTAINEMFPAALRATIFGSLSLAGAVGGIVAQSLIAIAAPRYGASVAVGALALLGLPTAVLLVMFLPETRPDLQPDRPSSGRQPWLVRIAFAAGVWVLALLALETAVRALAPRAVMVPWQDDILGVTAPKMEVRGRFAIANAFETTITIHNRFRSSHPVDLDPPAGATRLAVLGDSATFGWGAEDDQTYPAVLQAQLNAARTEQSSRTFDVLNAGVIGTGTGEQALWYDLWVKQFKPSIVVLSVFWNDVDDDAHGAFFALGRDGVVPRPYEVLDKGLSSVRLTRTVANHTPGFAWLSEHSQLLSWVRQGPTNLLLGWHARAVGADAPATAVDQQTPLDRDDLSRFAWEILWLKKRLPADGQLAVVFVPSAEMFDRARPDADRITAESRAIVATLESLSADTRIPFVDLTGPVRRAAPPSALYFAHDPHPNASGYRVIAEQVASFLKDRRIVD